MRRSAETPLRWHKIREVRPYARRINSASDIAAQRNR